MVLLGMHSYDNIFYTLHYLDVISGFWLGMLDFVDFVFVYKLLVFDDLNVPTHKTKYIVNHFNQMEGTKKLLLVDGGPIDEKLKLATQNLHYVNVLPAIGLNVYSILLHDTLVMSRDAVNRIVERMHTPINR
ncbi:putative ribosomal protein L4/L1e [Lupinus albus]|uniref:Large ribosomal subunit protein uL4m n=1 Tax=Lupinus albus TaxID=3870 RepID=A0A6A4NPS0_LUPAL|nr:putative ribosomal protein L4/L1e [Lupinus albus]